MTKYFEALEEVYENRHQYSLDWAYRDAQEKLNDMKKIISERTLVDLKAKEVYKARTRRLGQRKWFSDIFRNTLNLLTILEFLLSVVLVLLISQMSHQGDLFVNTRLFSFSVLLVFAFIKVFLEHFFLRPSLEKLGWELYKKNIDDLKLLALDHKEMRGDI